MPPEAVDLYLDQDAVAAWLPLGSMNGGVHAFDGCEGCVQLPLAGEWPRASAPSEGLLRKVDPQLANRLVDAVRIR